MGWEGAWGVDKTIIERDKCRSSGTVFTNNAESILQKTYMDAQGFNYAYDMTRRYYVILDLTSSIW